MDSRKQSRLYCKTSNRKRNDTIGIKAAKMPVGKHERQNESFIQQTLKLEKGDMIYAITDGFPDQFGGDKGKKFMSKNLKELLRLNSQLPVQEQKDILEKTLKIG